MPAPFNRRAFLRSVITPALALALGGCAGGGTPTSGPATATIGTAPTPLASPATPPTRGVIAPSSPTRPPAATATRASTATTTRVATANAVTTAPLVARVREYLLPRGSAPYGVALTADGTAWYSGQRAGELGKLDPATGTTKGIALGQGAAPRGLTVGPDGALWIADSGRNVLVRVDPATEEVRRITLPANSENIGLDALVFAPDGRLWFTGERGRYGLFDLRAGLLQLFAVPRDAGAGGIAATPGGVLYFTSFDGNYLAQVAPDLATATPLDLPIDKPGPRRVASDSRGRLWTTAWGSGQLALYDPANGRWRAWSLPGRQPRPRAVHADAQDRIWLTDDTANAILRFDLATEQFAALALPTAAGPISQLASRPGELWGAESGADRLVVLREG